jgi:selenide,water dikinase
VLAGLKLRRNPQLIIGIQEGDDAGVYQLTEELALIQTVDFFPPIVDDPWHFGRIAAVNALSDVYAMGGKPICALSLVAFPSKKLPLEVLDRTLAGALSALDEAGALLVGGHSIDDSEFKFGLSLSGLVHPKKIFTKRGVRSGDGLLLTKPLGTGIISTAVKAGLATPQAQQAALDSMSRLNAAAAEAAAAFEIHACTDVTGFGLAGHALEMLAAGEAGLEISLSALPLLPDLEEFCARGLLPGGLHRNRKYYGPRVEGLAAGDWRGDLLFDPQTSGGLLIALAEEQAEKLRQELQRRGIAASRIGRATAQPPGKIAVLP